MLFTFITGINIIDNPRVIKSNPDEVLIELVELVGVDELLVIALGSTFIPSKEYSPSPCPSPPIFPAISLNCA